MNGWCEWGCEGGGGLIEEGGNDLAAVALEKVALEKVRLKKVTLEVWEGRN